MSSNPTCPDGKLWTPLHAAAARGHEGIVRLLTCHPHIDLNRKGIFGETALDLALRASCVSAANVLLSTRGIQAPDTCVNPDGTYLFSDRYSDAINRLLQRHLMAGNAQVELEDEWA
ncbi:unnamed protein product [Tuber aestivum]|uniref:Uncharacterized protein n=1 Tax=Tuber aestivum TaxID=59557 RepID=A0A292PYR4_9PEZI|nr:unnamed protein product [Tuber aestivum]